MAQHSNSTQDFNLNYQSESDLRPDISIPKTYPWLSMIHILLPTEITDCESLTSQIRKSTTQLFNFKAPYFNFKCRSCMSTLQCDIFSILISSPSTKSDFQLQWMRFNDLLQYKRKWNQTSSNFQIPNASAQGGIPFRVSTVSISETRSLPSSFQCHWSQTHGCRFNHAFASFVEHAYLRFPSSNQNMSELPISMAQHFQSTNASQPHQLDRFQLHPHTQIWCSGVPHDVLSLTTLSFVVELGNPMAVCLTCKIHKVLTWPQL